MWFHDSALIPISWSAAFEVGVPDLDVEHRVLVTLYNDFVLATNRRVSLTLRWEILDSIRACAALHIQHEKRLLCRLPLPGAIDQPRVHRLLLDDLPRPGAGDTDLLPRAEADRALRNAAHILRRRLLAHFQDDLALFAARPS
jgi:hypothetical protein